MTRGYSLDDDDVDEAASPFFRICERLVGLFERIPAMFEYAQVERAGRSHRGEILALGDREPERPDDAHLRAHHLVQVERQRIGHGADLDEPSAAPERRDAVERHLMR